MSLTTTSEESNNSSLRLVAAIAAALLLVGGIAYGYMKLRARHAQQNAPAAVVAPTPPPPARAKIYEDEPRPQGRQAVISGTVENTSGAALSDITVEVELTPRSRDKAKERRTIALAPQTLAAQQQGAYSVLVSSDDYAKVHAVAVKSGGNLVCLPSLQPCFAPGKKRPLETTPDAPANAKRTITLPPTPKPRRPKGDEVINTPETADRY